jgi:hypothetical protein
MSDEIALQTSAGGGRWRGAATCVAMFGYCFAIFLLLDFAWSSLTRGDEQRRGSRISHPVYDHGFAAKFEGHEAWGKLRYAVITNNLGFKDASTRDVPLKSSSRRVLLMGDSFAEGIGLAYEDSFAGLLQRAGQARSDKVEFLNAGAVSYSPSIYYKKIKYLLDAGLQFDEVVLFSDSSDVFDEATTYFCIDDDPKYRAHCTATEGSSQPKDIPRQPDFFAEHFVMTNRVRASIKPWMESVLGYRENPLDHDPTRIGWAIPGLDVAEDYKPLGIDGGIQRSLQNMGRLADMLAARNIPLTIVVYPWAQQVARGDRHSRQVALWREFCEKRCKAFIDLFPAFLVAREADPNWYEHLYIVGDDHFSAAGNEIVARDVEKRLLR